MPVPTYNHPQYLSLGSIPETFVHIHQSLPSPLHGRHAVAASHGGRHAAAASLQRRLPTQRRR
jgi:hypothetical protein